jgi:ATP-dependent Clp protease adaptor protein ClpS
MPVAHAVAVEKVKPDRRKRSAPRADNRPRRQPRYHVVLWDDDEHTYDYVIRMMQQLFGHSQGKGMLIATEVDTVGRAICLTTTREHAELKRDQIRAFGPDGLMSKSRGSMRASIEPAPE